MNNPSVDKLQYGDSIFIIESVGTAKPTSKGKNAADYVLRGPAAFFGELNNNGRIYEATDYLPHMTYLQEKIKTRGLTGELDHPKEFETSLQRVSHIVESLDYDKNTNSVNIQIRLVDTPHGNIAKALIESGVTLSISSRAAGQVTENNKVRLKRIFTYDLVADPGFERAQVRQICESANYDLNNDLATDFSTGKSIIDNLVLVNESLGIQNENVQVYKVPTSNKQFAALIGEQEESKKDTKNSMNNYVTVDEMDGYSKIILSKITELQEKLNTPTKETSNEKLEELEKYIKYIAENLDKSITYQNYLAENLDSVIEYSKYLAENVDRNISYSEYIAEQVDNSIAYGEYLGENLENSIAYGEYVAEQVDTVISYGDYIAEHLRNSISYSEYLGENLETSIAYSEYIVEKTESLINYADYLAESVENIGADMITESVVTKPTTKPVKENMQIIAESANDLTTKIDMLIESANKKKAVAKSDYHFFKFINEQKREAFEKLDETSKTKVVNALEDKAYFNEAQVIQKWNAALLEKQAVSAPTYIEKMPANVKPAYEALTEAQKLEIEAAAKLHKLETQYQINHFWSTRSQINKDSIGLIKLTESAQTTEKKTTAIDPRVQSLANQIGKKFGK